MASTFDFMPQIIGLICPSCDVNIGIAIFLIFFFEGFFTIEYLVSIMGDKEVYKKKYKETSLIVKTVFVTVIEATSFYFWFLAYFSLEIIWPGVVNYVDQSSLILVLLMGGFLTGLTFMTLAYRFTKDSDNPQIIHPASFWSSLAFLISAGAYITISKFLADENILPFIIIFVIAIILIILFTYYPKKVSLWANDKKLVKSKK